MRKSFDFLIVGQGLAGSILSFELMKHNASVLVVDDYHNRSSSKIAAGIINPVTGRRYVKSWMIDQLIPKALNTYATLEQLLGEKFVNRYSIARALHSVSNENDWEERRGNPSYKKYIDNEVDMSYLENKMRLASSYGLISGGAQVMIGKLIKSFRLYLNNNNSLIEECFEYDQLEFLDDQFLYQGLAFKNIVFAEGQGIRNNPFFQSLPFEANKGEVFQLDIPNLNLRHILRDKIFLVPQGDYIWSGGGYNRFFEDILPSDQFYKDWNIALNELLKIPFKILGHKAAIRLASKDRRALIGEHPKYKGMFLFNGFGTKGASLIPFFAAQFGDKYYKNIALNSEVNINRYNWFH